MTESQRLVMNWRAELQGQGWPVDAIKRIISDLVEAGYRQCVDDIQARSARNEAVIQKAVSN